MKYSIGSKFSGYFHILLQDHLLKERFIPKELSPLKVEAFTNPNLSYSVNFKPLFHLRFNSLRPSEPSVVILVIQIWTGKLNNLF